MTTRIFARSVLATLGLCFAFASSGYADDLLYHASLCNPGGQTPVGQAVYDQFGIANVSSSSSLTVNCGGVVVFSAIGDIIEVDVTVYDRNTLADVVCTLMTVDLGGIATTTGTQLSSGSSASAQVLTFSRPEGDTHQTTISLQCVIPPFGALGASHVTTYRVISTP
jgi:hypothetical protein